MVQFAHPGDLDSKHASMKPAAASSVTESGSAKRTKVKAEIEDSADEECRHAMKRSKFPTPFQQWSMGTSTGSSHQSLYNPLDEPSPLGLRLRKSPSLLDLIQMRLAQEDPTKFGVSGNENSDSTQKKDSKLVATSSTSDKLKASNFPASLLKIGSWECLSRYEGDLVAKCYFAKHKLVWEVLDGGLKSKIEIQWSDITALKATFPDNGPGTLDIVLARQPLFFKETNPQPRKHTLWQATSDFTGGQATLHRRHFLQVPHGLLNKHFEKLIQCDPRLNLLSQREDVNLQSPYFDHRGSTVEDQDDLKFQGFDHLKNDSGSSFSGCQDPASPCTAQSVSFKSEPMDHVGHAHEPVSWQTPSPSSVVDSRGIEEPRINGEVEAKSEDEAKSSNVWEHLKFPGLRPSMSITDLVDHIENCITEQMTSRNSLYTDENAWNKDVLAEISQQLLGDAQQNAMDPDEQRLMSRVNSLYCLLEQDKITDGEARGTFTISEGDQSVGGEDDDTVSPLGGGAKTSEFGASSNFEQNNSSKPNSTMSRKDSLGDLLLSLPRIASLPQFLFNVPDDPGSKAR